AAGAARAPRDEGPGRSASVYVLADSAGVKALKQVRVRVGITDGTVTELFPGSLQEGAQVVVGQEENGERRGGTPNPMAGGGGPMGPGRPAGGGGRGGR
ncbi:MAG TPA: hypothetical protein VLT84_05020, partial [Acidobacteriota bacterium]|nr:hypothetical protein [Acidobacteriota bacterium]